MNTECAFAQINGTRIAYEVRGNGYPLLLLHGFPRNRKVWSRVTPALTRRFTVLTPDRRGYGDSDRPPASAGYDNGTMVEDALELVRHLGWTRCLVVGHDRGAPVARRLAAGHPDLVTGAMIMDSLPQGAGYEPPRDPSGRAWYLDFFRQRGVAEQLIGQNPRLFFSLFISRHQHLTPEEHEYYLETFCRSGSTEAVLADYRAGAEIDAPYWEEEHRAGRRITIPLYLIWGGRGPVAGSPVLEIWRRVAENVQGQAIANSAHYIQEEQPEATIEQIEQFASQLGIS